MKKLSAFGFILPGLVALFLFLYTWIFRAEMWPFAVYGTYYFILALFVSWLAHVTYFLGSVNFSLKQFLRTYCAGLIFAAALAVLTVLSVTPSFKVLSDETNLLAISKSMCFQKTILNVTQGLRYYGAFTSLNPGIDVRPYLFPFFVSLIHTLVGYHSVNAFAMNFIVMVLTLSLVFICAEIAVDRMTAYAATLLVASCPHFSISGTSAGFDLLGAFFLGLSLVNLYGFMSVPTDGKKFALLWMNLLMLANIRQDGSIYFLIMIGALAVCRYLRYELLKEAGFAVAMTPLFFLPLIWQRILTPHPFETAKGVDPFTLDHLYRHFVDMANSQFNWKFDLPYPNLLHLLAVLVYIYVLFDIFVAKKVLQKPHQKHMAVIVFISILVYLVFILSYHTGIYTLPVAIRYFIPFSMVCVLAPVLFLALYPGNQKRNSFIVLMLSILSFILYHPIAVEGRFMDTLILKRETEFSYEILKLQPQENMMVVTNRPGQYTVLDYGAVSFDYANQHRQELKSHLDRHLIRTMFIIQRIAYGNLQPVADENLDPAYLLETLAEEQTSGESFVRISRVKSISEHPVRPQLPGRLTKSGKL